MLNRYAFLLIFATVLAACAFVGCAMPVEQPPPHVDAGTCNGCLNSSHGCETGTDDLVCGKAGESCQECLVNNGAGACVERACVFVQCDTYWMDCDGIAANGCETEKTDHDHCGACDVACGPTSQCRDAVVDGMLKFACD